MSLTIRHITLSNFRSYAAFELSDIGPLTILVGPNATGKTNLMEALRLVTAQRTLRHASTDQLVRKDCTYTSITADISDGNRQLSLETRIIDNKRHYLLNGKSKRNGDMKGIIPSVAFVPDDLNLAKGSMSTRRQAVDALGEQLSMNHYLIRKDYEKLLKHKNSALKEGCEPDILDAVNEIIVTVGAQLTCYRAALFSKLMVYLASFYQEITDEKETVSGYYIPSWERDSESVLAHEYNHIPFVRDEARDLLRACLNQRKGEELARRRSLVGPHADTIEFQIDGMNVAAYGSQGQQRSLVLAFKLAEVALIHEILGQQPIILLDDVMSELDDDRRQSLISFLSKDMQTFITTAHLDYFDNETLYRARVVTLGKEKGSTFIERDTPPFSGREALNEAVKCGY
ncbi:DNA replication/repair protein RecF [Adlercreutzia sp. ZJ138]|uniref:DNA replication/repair protein RecF n=1 Tax=Adlercreutzia sp. ZJ138 TaxID=2709405 RepID=UPI0013EE1AAF|nr:DNA replication and repair protein RecF [Adlercreutzia sp. ZJ138]